MHWGLACPILVVSELAILGERSLAKPASHETNFIAGMKQIQVANEV